MEAHIVQIWKCFKWSNWIPKSWFQLYSWKLISRRYTLKLEWLCMTFEQSPKIKSSWCQFYYYWWHQRLPLSLKKKVVMMPTLASLVASEVVIFIKIQELSLCQLLSSLVAQEVVIMTTSCATSDDKFGIMTTVFSDTAGRDQCDLYFSYRLITGPCRDNVLKQLSLIQLKRSDKGSLLTHSTWYWRTAFKRI